jgi:Putative transposase
MCRYITRPAIAAKRLSVDSRGRVVYQYKHAFRDGSTHVVLEPLDFMFRMNGMPRAQGCAGAAIARLAALVPCPRLNLTRFHSAGESDRTSCAQRKQ